MTGTFDDWAKTVKLQHNGTCFEAIVGIDLKMLEDDEIMYKFWVDGEWVVDLEKPTKYDQDGNRNNFYDYDALVIEVDKLTLLSSPQETFSHPPGLAVRPAPQSIDTALSLAFVSQFATLPASNTTDTELSLHDLVAAEDASIEQHRTFERLRAFLPTQALQYGVGLRTILSDLPESYVEDDGQTVVCEGHVVGQAVPSHLSEYPRPPHNDLCGRYVDAYGLIANDAGRIIGWAYR